MHGASVRIAVKIFSLFLLWTVVVVPSAFAQEKGQVLKFAVFPYKSPRSVIETFGPLASRIEQKIGRKVQVVSATDPGTFLARGLAGDYDLALPSVTVYYRMLPAGYTAIAKGVPTFYGGVIVRQDSEIRNIDQCKGKKIGAIGEDSYAGYIFFADMLQAQKIDPAREVDIHFLGKLDTVIYGVLNKKWDAGVIRLDTLEMKEFAPIKSQLRVVARSVEIPQFPFVVKKDMDPRTVAMIREVLGGLSPGKPADMEILKSLQIERIVPATKADYDPFYETLKHSEYYKK